MNKLRTINLVGGRGYTGSELLRLLAGHPQMDLGIASSRSEAGLAICSTCDGWPDDGRTFTRLMPGCWPCQMAWPVSGSGLSVPRFLLV